MKTEKAEILRGMIDNAVINKPSKFKEAFDKLLHQKAMKLVNKEKSRMASVCFAESYVSRSEITSKVSESVEGSMYNKIHVLNSDLFQRESKYMPEWMQNATIDGVDIEPIKEKDAIDLSSKYHSIEFSSDN